VKLGDEDEKSLKSLEKHYKQEYTPLTDYLKGLYKNKVCVLFLLVDLLIAVTGTDTATRAVPQYVVVLTVITASAFNPKYIGINAAH
jgi:hypothetical protein